MQIPSPMQIPYPHTYAHLCIQTCTHLHIRSFQTDALTWIRQRMKTTRPHECIKATRVHQDDKSESRPHHTTTTISPTEAAPQHVARTRQDHTTRRRSDKRRRDLETARQKTAFDKTKHRLLPRLNSTTPTHTYLSIVHHMNSHTHSHTPLNKTNTRREGMNR
jgi:hypothetical protein